MDTYKYFEVLIVVHIPYFLEFSFPVIREFETEFRGTKSNDLWGHVKLYEVKESCLMNYKLILSE